MFCFIFFAENYVRKLRSNAEANRGTRPVQDGLSPPLLLSVLVTAPPGGFGADKEIAKDLTDYFKNDGILSVPGGLDPTPDSNAQERAERPRAHTQYLLRGVDVGRHGVSNGGIHARLGHFEHSRVCAKYFDGQPGGPTESFCHAGNEVTRGDQKT